MQKLIKFLVKQVKIFHLNGISANFCCFIIGDLSPLLPELVTYMYACVTVCMHACMHLYMCLYLGVDMFRSSLYSFWFSYSLLPAQNLLLLLGSRFKVTSGEYNKFYILYNYYNKTSISLHGRLPIGIISQPIHLFNQPL